MSSITSIHFSPQRLESSPFKTVNHRQKQEHTQSTLHSYHQFHSTITQVLNIYLSLPDYRARTQNLF